jgi:hypothetical protein
LQQLISSVVSRPTHRSLIGDQRCTSLTLHKLLTFAAPAMHCTTFSLLTRRHLNFKVIL